MLYLKLLCNCPLKFDKFFFNLVLYLCKHNILSFSKVPYGNSLLISFLYHIFPELYVVGYKTRRK